MSFGQQAHEQINDQNKDAFSLDCQVMQIRLMSRGFRYVQSRSELTFSD